MYKPLEEFLKQEEYKHFTLRKLQILHQRGYLKTITGKNGKHLTTEINSILKRKPLRKNNVLKIIWK